MTFTARTQFELAGCPCAGCSAGTAALWYALSAPVVGLMPITYEIDEHVGLVTLRFTGTVTDADLIAVSTRLYQDPRHRAGMAELSDCRGVERLEVTGKGLRRLAESTGLLLDQARTGWKSAIVVSGDLDFGLGRMYELLREASPEHVCVFRDFAAAERWLRQP